MREDHGRRVCSPSMCVYILFLLVSSSMRRIFEFHHVSKSLHTTSHHVMLSQVKGVADSAASSSQPAKSSDVEPEAAVKPVKCNGNCGFFGNPKNEGYCSKCFKEKQEKDQEEIRKKQEDAEKAKEEEEKKAKGEGAGDDKKGDEKKVERPVQENKTRCWVCSKKCGLAGRSGRFAGRGVCW